MGGGGRRHPRPDLSLPCHWEHVNYLEVDTRPFLPEVWRQNKGARVDLSGLGGDMAQLSTDEKILQRLDQILRVLAIQVGGEESLTERVRLLKLAGLDNQTIADVLNTTADSVRALSSNLAKKRPRRRTPAKERANG